MANSIIGKISVKTVYGAIKKDAIPAEGEKKFVMRVFGIASGLKSGESSFGGWTALTGQFKAVNLDTQEEFQSGKAFLPEVALSLVEGALSQADAESVQFAFDVGIVRDEKGATGYQYIVQPLVEASDNDPLAQLENKLKALPAPDAKAKK